MEQTEVSRFSLNEIHRVLSFLFILFVPHSFFLGHSVIQLCPTHVYWGKCPLYSMEVIHSIYFVIAKHISAKLCYDIFLPPYFHLKAAMGDTNWIR